jgi:hypothetical protein
MRKTKEFSEPCPTCGKAITLQEATKMLRKQGFKTLAKLLEMTSK